MWHYSCWLFSYMADNDGGWVRIGRVGWGIAINDRNKNPAPFSVRINARIERRIGRWGVRVLRPNS